jgi:hypothetical protein
MARSRAPITRSTALALSSLSSLTPMNNTAARRNPVAAPLPAQANTKPKASNSQTDGAKGCLGPNDYWGTELTGIGVLVEPVHGARWTRRGDERR